MIEIVKHGNKRKAECNECGCVFRYEREDTKCQQYGMNEWKTEITCPDCGKVLDIGFWNVL